MNKLKKKIIIAVAPTFLVFFLLLVVIMGITAAFTAYGATEEQLLKNLDGEVINQIDEYLDPINAKIEETGGTLIDKNFVYAVYLVLFTQHEKEPDFYEKFLDCFYIIEINETTLDEKYTAQLDYEQLYSDLGQLLGEGITIDKRQLIEEYRQEIEATAHGAILSPIEGVDVLQFITSPFGTRSDPFTGKTKTHGGLDISYGGIHGVPAVSVANGVVIKSEYESGWGNYVKVRHTDKTSTLYAHLDSQSVKVDDKVIAGQEIGKIGNTGRSSGSHLHFEVYVNGTRVNPVPYIKGDTLID